MPASVPFVTFATAGRVTFGKGRFILDALGAVSRSRRHQHVGRPSGPRVVTGVPDMGDKRQVEPGGADPRCPVRLCVSTTLRNHLMRLAAVVVLACVLALGPLQPDARGADP